MYAMDVMNVVVVLFSVPLISSNVVEAESPFHLMPLGSHTKPTNIEEVTMENMISSEVFAKDYIIPQKPLIFRGLTQQWPAYTKWTDVYLNTNYAKLELRLGKMRRESKMPPQGDICLGRDSLAHFISTYNKNDEDKVVESELPTPLYKYVQVPPPLGCGNLSKSLVEVDLWMSSGEVKSALRKHSLNRISCVVNGSKKWKVVEPIYNHHVYEIWKGDTEEQGHTDYSHVDPDKVDLKRFPIITKIPKWLFASLNAGDCLYLPSGSWHTVHSEGDKNVAVGFVFQTFQEMNQLEFVDCADKPLSLEEVDPDWKYTGYGLMSMGNSPFPYYLDLMNSFFGLWDKVLNYDNVYLVLSKLMAYLPYSDTHTIPRTRTLFNELSALSGTAPYTLDKLPSLSRKKLRRLINNCIQPPIPANSCDQEYSYFPPDQVSMLFENVSKANDGVVDKDKFIAAYVNMGGHVDIATYIWTRFAHEKTKVKFQIYNVRLDRAVEKFNLFWMANRESERLMTYEAEQETVEGDLKGFKDEL